MVAMVTDRKTMNIARAVLLPSGRKQIIHAVDGVLWITQTGNAEDMLLHAGESRSFSGRERIAVQPLNGEATFVVEKVPGCVQTVLRNLTRRLWPLAINQQAITPIQPSSGVCAGDCSA